MSDPSLPDPKTNPDQSVVPSEQAQPMTPTPESGGAMLDAHIETGETQPEGEPVEHPAATNFTDQSATGEAKTADVSVMAGPRSTGKVNLRHQSDIADESMQGRLPDTDSTGMPSDRGVNLSD